MLMIILQGLLMALGTAFLVSRFMDYNTSETSNITH